MSEPSDYQLRKWSRLVRIRDAENGRGRCVMCRGFFSIWQLQAHHIWPKSLFPDRALDPDNGVSLCAGCHQGPTHAQSPSVDVINSAPDAGWRMWVPSFSAWVLYRNGSGQLEDLLAELNLSLADGMTLSQTILEVVKEGHSTAPFVALVMAQERFSTLCRALGHQPEHLMAG